MRGHTGLTSRMEGMEPESVEAHLKYHFASVLARSFLDVGIKWRKRVELTFLARRPSPS
jgi:hypothetical protein